MLEIILLFFLSRSIGKMAVARGLPPAGWKIRTVINWIVCEFLGIYLAIALFGFTAENIISLSVFGIVSGFGGYLMIRHRLEKIEIKNQE